MQVGREQVEMDDVKHEAKLLMVGGWMVH